MKKILSLLSLGLLLSCSKNNLYQAPRPEMPTNVTRVNEANIEVDEMPSFPQEGGQSLELFLAKNLKYPEEALTRGITGIVHVGFFVEIDGRLTDVKVVRSVHSLLDKAALQVVRAMPNWKPAKRKGQPIRMKYVLPVVYRLNVVG